MSVSKVYNKHLSTGKLALIITCVISKECINEDVRTNMIVSQNKIICFYPLGKTRVVTGNAHQLRRDSKRGLIHINIDHPLVSQFVNMYPF